MQPDYPFVLILANKERKAAHLASLFLIGITLLVAIVYTATHLSLQRIPLIVIILFLLLYTYFKLTRKSVNGFPQLMWPIAIAGLAWFLIPKGFFIAIVYLIAAVFEKQSQIPIEIGLDSSGITFNHFPQKFYPWDQIQQLIIKDGLVTIDYKNNRIFQKELENTTTKEEETEVNQYCQQFLS
jgi:hypothetical protein